MTDRKYIRLNTSISTATNTQTLTPDDEGNIPAVIELGLPANISSDDVKAVDLEITKMRVSMKRTPIAAFKPLPSFYASSSLVDTLDTPRINYTQTAALISVWPAVLHQTGVITNFFTQWTAWRDRWTVESRHTPMVALSVPKVLETPLIEAGSESIMVTEFSTLEAMLENAICNSLKIADGLFNAEPHLKVSLKADTFSITLNTAIWEGAVRVFYGTPFCYQDVIDHNGPFYKDYGHTYRLRKNSSGEIEEYVPASRDDMTSMFNIVGNSALRDTLHFLPWIKVPIERIKNDPNLNPLYFDVYDYNSEKYLYILDFGPCNVTVSEPQTMIGLLTQTEGSEVYGYDITYTWENIPVVTMSPINSIVLLMNGMDVLSQIQPINFKQAGGSSLTTVVPIIENYYSLATTLRDLHDELVISRDQFSSNAVIKVNPNSLKERTVSFKLGYITKDGSLHTLMINAQTVFSLQLTFCLYY